MEERKEASKENSNEKGGDQNSSDNESQNEKNEEHEEHNNPKEKQIEEDNEELEKIKKEKNNLDNEEEVESQMLYKGDDIKLFDNDNEEGLLEKSSFRTHFDMLINDPSFRRVLQFISFFLSVFIFIVYIITTYFPYANLLWYNILNVIFATYFNLETLMHLYLAQRRWTYLLTINGFIYLFSSIYPYFYACKNRYNQMFLELSRVLQIFRISRFVSKNIKINENDVIKFIINMVQIFAVTIFFFACVFRIVELEDIEELLMHPDNRYHNIHLQTKFHDFLYYIVITISTVGYGDIYPVSEYGRLVIICLVIYAAYLIPEKTGELLKIMVNTNIYSREIYKAIPEIPHIVICGDVTVDALVSFCDELFHEDHGQTDKNVIILNNMEPSPEMRLFLHAGKYEMNLRYLQGNPMNERDLDKTDIANAEAIAILTDKYSSNPNSTDHKNVLLALNIKKYLLKRKRNDSTLYLQLIKPENKVNYLRGVESLSSSTISSKDRIIILEEIKMNLLSKSCLIPGIIPLIANLVSSAGGSNETEFTWLNEYLDGVDQEIYREELNETFKNNTFAEISKFIFQNFDAIAFALEIETDGKTFITLNPGNFYIAKSIEEREDIKFWMYLICSDKEVAQRIGRADATKPIKEEDDDDEDENNNGDDNDDSGEEEADWKLSKKSEKDKEKYNKFQRYMKLRFKDINLLEENTSNDHKKESESDSYYFSPTPRAQRDIIKETIRNNYAIKDHIIVCGTHPSLFYFLLPLRSKILEQNKLKHVVILTQKLPEELWESITKFEKITLIKGSPLLVEDLYRANIEFASKVVILDNEAIRECSFSDKIIDSERVFIYKTIKKCNPMVQIMTELVFDSNIEFMLPQYELSELDPKDISYRLTSVFSSGEVYMSNIIDSLTAQAYYNKHIVTIIHQLLTGGETVKNGTIKKIYEEVGLHSSNFLQVNVPEKFINKTFGELYDDFAEHYLIPLALYRLPGARDNITSYIYTKPNAETKISHRDRIFVLGSAENLEYLNEECNKAMHENYMIEENNKMISDNLVTVEENNCGSPLENIKVYKENYLFTHFKNKLCEIEEQVENLNRIFETTAKGIKQSVANGIKQEMSSLLDMS